MDRPSRPPVSSEGAGIKSEPSEAPEQPTSSDALRNSRNEEVKREESEEVRNIKQEAESNASVDRNVSQHQSQGRVMIDLTGDDSDDDLMIIEESDLSQAAKNRLKNWRPAESSKPSNGGQSSGSQGSQPAVKAEQVEQGIQNPQREHLEQAQQLERIEQDEIIQQVQEQEQIQQDDEVEEDRNADGRGLFATPDPDGDFEGDEYEVLSDGSEQARSPRPKRAAKPPRKTIENKSPSPAQEEPTLVSNELDADGESSEAESDRALRNLEDNIAILRIQTRMLEREKTKPGFKGQPKLDYYEARITELLEEVKNIETDNKRRQRNKPASDAREYWHRRYGRKQHFIKCLNKKRTRDSATSAGRARKRQKVGSGGMVESDEASPKDDIKVMKNIDPVKALAEMGEIPMPGAMVADTKSQLMKQLKSFKKLNPADGDFKNDHKALEEATRSFGFRKCVLDKDAKPKGKRAKMARWKLTGLKTSLYSHQVVGASFMVGRELSPLGPFGGLMCDEMGGFS